MIGYGFESSLSILFLSLKHVTFYLANRQILMIYVIFCLEVINYFRLPIDVASGWKLEAKSPLPMSILCNGHCYQPTKARVYQ